MGSATVEMALRRAGKGYVLGVNSNHHFRSWQRNPAVAGTAEQIAATLDLRAGSACRRVKARKVARLHDWVYCELADLDVAEYDTHSPVCGRAAC